METVTISLERYTNMCNQTNKKIKELEAKLKISTDYNDKVFKINEELIQALKEVGIDAKYNDGKIVFTNNHFCTMIRSDKIFDKNE